MSIRTLFNRKLLIHNLRRQSKPLAIAIATASLLTTGPQLSLAQQDQAPQPRTAQEQPQRTAGDAIQQNQPRSPQGNQKPSGQQLGGLQPGNQQPRTQAQQQPGQQQPGQQGPAELNYAHEAPALGVMVGECPGAGVCIRDTIWNGPADAAGIEQGDYILAVSDKAVNSADELRQALQQVDTSREIPLRVWRDGQEFNVNVWLASQAKELPPHFKAWLGVRLTSNNGDGVEVDQIIPNSPAAGAGIRQGDIIQQINGEPLKTVDQLIERVADQGPGSTVNILLTRNGVERTADVQLGSVEEAPMSYLRQAYQPQMIDGYQGGYEGQGGQMTSYNNMMDGAIDEMRNRIRVLEQQLQAKQGRAGGQSSNATPLRANPLDPQSPDVRRSAELPAQQDTQPQPANATEPQQKPDAKDRENSNRDDSSRENTSHLVTPDGVQFVVQRDRGDNNDWNRRRNSNRGSNWNSYGNQNWYYRNGYPNYNSYYGNRYYRSPGYGNWYYQYGGRPYYNSGNNWYGYGSGLRLNPNLGLYWY